MKPWIAAFVLPLLALSPALAESPTVAETPTTQESAEFPTPAELIKRMQAAQAKSDNAIKIAHFDIASAVAEKPAGFSLFGDPDADTLHSLLERLRSARENENVKAVLVTLGPSGLNLSQATEVRDAFGALKKANKRVFVYADGYDTASYIIASGASDICLLPGGEIMIPGVGLESTFALGLLDKVGVKADYVQIGEYKGADEQMTRSEASPELRGEMNKLADALFGQIVSGISEHRDLPADRVTQMIDDTILGAGRAKTDGFVDHLVDQDGLRELITKELGGEIELLSDYGAVQAQRPDFSNLFALMSSLAKKPELSTKDAIAIIYAQGTIVDGEAGGGLLGGEEGVGSDPMRRAFRNALKDPRIKAVVIRIDSPGGSALASEVMWQSVRNLAAKKPVVISIGGMAASGGYYLASAGDVIYADPTAIVGSIGVVGGKFVTKDLFDKLGIHTESFSRGKNADLFSSNQPFNDRQRRLVTNWMKQTYEQFTQRVMTTRAGKIKDIDAVARGRIFIAKDAKALGMVDELGGLTDALDAAATRANLAHGDYDVRTLPTPRTLSDLIGGGSGMTDDDAEVEPETLRALKPSIQIGEDSLIRALSPSLRQALGQQLQMIQLLQRRPVLLASPFIVTVR